jgi:ribosome biogenesis GTPase
MDTSLLEKYGWKDFFAQQYLPHAEGAFVPARVSAEHRGSFLVLTAGGEIPAEVTGRMMFQAEDRLDYPVVGDWVLVHLLDKETHAVIHSVLTRRTLLLRKTAGKDVTAQTIAANIDIVFIITGLDGNYNLRRIERYLVAVQESGAKPVVLLNKCDLAKDVQGRLCEALAVAGPARVLLVSALTGTGMDDLERLIAPGVTSCFVGSSGAGKSTLINRLAGTELVRTAEVREIDSRGRHTTTHRQMFVLPSGAIVIDTPGMRELGIVDADGGIENTFADIEQLGRECRFRNCSHTIEQGCAVLAAIEIGDLDKERLKSFLKLKGEVLHNEAKLDIKAKLERKGRDRMLARAIRDVLKKKGGK